MGATRFLIQIRTAIRHLNPASIRRAAERDVRVGLFAYGGSSYAAMEEFLLPPDMSARKRQQTLALLPRTGEPDSDAACDLEIYEEGIVHDPNGFTFWHSDPDATVRAILEQHDGLGLPLARQFPAFRPQVVDSIIRTIAKENALFSLATALPDVIPSVLMLPWAAGQFASDTAFLTLNQIRMLFMLAAASDREVGYGEQRTEIGSVIAAAFGWRALARQLSSKIPLGGGLIAKAGIAYAGTYAVGASFERLYRLGYGFSREERQSVYEEAFEQGRAIAGAVVQSLRK